VEQSSGEVDSHSTGQETSIIFHETQEFNTVPTAGNWVLFWARWIQSTPLHPICLRPSLLLTLYYMVLIP